jgi:hypothetical protein
MRRPAIAFVILLASGVGAAVLAQHQGHGTAGAPGDARQLVAIPEPMQSHMLANMRDHLTALQEIQAALAAGKFDAAASIAESRIGMSSLELHGASHIAGFMPEGMRDAGTLMHRSASRFALVAQEASVGGDLKAPVEAFSTLMQACVGCHAGYRTR